MEKRIIRMYFKTNKSLHTIAGIFNMRKIDIGIIIQRYKKKHNIR